MVPATWAWSIIMMVLPAYVVVQANANSDTLSNVGVNWGMISSHPLNPSITVGLLKDNGFKKVKLFDADSWTVNALAGTDIEVILGIPNDRLQELAKNYGAAKDWVKENATKHLHDGGVNIKYVAVGNEPFLQSYNGSFTQTTLPAMKNIQKALNEAGAGDKIKVTSPLNADVYKSDSDKPSDGDFRSDIKDLMIEIVKYLKENGSPFLVNIYPFLSLYQNSHFPQEFAFFDGGGTPVEDINGVKYFNVFDANYDTLLWSLKKVGVPDLKVIVGEVGWPTDGNQFANKTLAKKFYDGLFKKLAGNKGTPLRPGSKFEVYIFSLYDEDMKSIAPGNFERHWGIFRFDGKPKFPIDLSGNGNDKMPVGAKGVQYLPTQWCAYNKDALNQDKMPDQISWACANSDCTRLTAGSSCESLDNVSRVSYAFNIYFQQQDQDVEACKFKGLAKIVKQNLSTPYCFFPIQVVSAGVRLGQLGFAAVVLAGSLLMSLITLL